MDFSSLPLELKYHVFLFLTDVELKTKTHFVCKEWRLLSHCGTIVTDFGLLAIKNLLQLEELKLSEVTGGYARMFEGTVFPQMNRLCFTAGTLLDDNTLELIANSCPKLQTLIIRGKDNEQISYNGIRQIVHKCSCMTMLSLVSVKQINSDGFRQIWAEFPKLKYGLIDWWQFTR